MIVRGVRAAITVDQNDEQQILQATIELLQAVVEANKIVADDICSLFITCTEDLDMAFPAKAIRQLDGWEYVPLMCALEVPVKGSLQKCIRLMLHINTTKSQQEIEHIYLRGAAVLRPDLKQV